MARVGLALALMLALLFSQGATYARVVTRATGTVRTAQESAASRAARVVVFKKFLAARTVPAPIVYPVVGYPTKVASDAFWKPLVIPELKGHGIYSSDNLYHTLNVIWGESRGSTKAHTAGTQYYGLVQFGTDWVSNVGSSTYVAPSAYGTSKDWRMDGHLALQRLMRAVRDGGHGMWTKHWGQTCG